MPITWFCKSPKELYEHVRRGSSEQFLKRPLQEYELFRREFSSDNGQAPVNMMFELVSTCQSFCAVPYVRSSVTALDAQFTAQENILRMAMDHAYEEIGFAHCLSEDVVTQCLFFPICVVEIGRQEGPRTMEQDGESANLLETYTRHVDPWDLTLDPDATKWKERRFCGQRVCVKKSKIAVSCPFGMDDPMEQMDFGLPVMNSVEAAAWFATEADVAATGDTPTNISKRRMQKRDQGSAATSRPEQDEEVYLWKVAIYDGAECWVVYIADGDNQPERFIHAEKWDAIKIRDDGEGGELKLGGGSPDGPYRATSFQEVPGSILGISGLRTIMDLHDGAKKLSSKFLRETLALKNLFIYDKVARDDAARVVKAKDMDSLAVNDASKFQNLEVGGTRGELVPAIQELGIWFGNTGGGVRQIGGSEQAADTATASTYLQNGATMKMNRFRNRVWKLAKDVSKEIAFLTLFADPWKRQVMLMELAPNVQVPVEFVRKHFAQMGADALSFMFSVEPFPVPIFDPSMKAQQATQFLTLVMNFLPGIQMGIISPKGLLKLGRIYYGLDDVNELITIPEDPGAAMLIGQNISGLAGAQQTQAGWDQQMGEYMQTKLQQAVMAAIQQTMSGGAQGQPGPGGMPQPGQGGPGGPGGKPQLPGGGGASKGKGGAPHMNGQAKKPPNQAGRLQQSGGPARPPNRR